MNERPWEFEDLAPHISSSKFTGNKEPGYYCGICGKKIIVTPYKSLAKQYKYLPSGGAIRQVGYVHESCLRDRDYI